MFAFVGFSLGFAYILICPNSIGNGSYPNFLPSSITQLEVGAFSYTQLGLNFSFLIPQSRPYRHKKVATFPSFPENQSALVKHIFQHYPEVGIYSEQSVLPWRGLNIYAPRYNVA